MKLHEMTIRANDLSQYSERFLKWCSNDLPLKLKTSWEDFSVYECVHEGKDIVVFKLGGEAVASIATVDLNVRNYVLLDVIAVDSNSKNLGVFRSILRFLLSNYDGVVIGSVHSAEMTKVLASGLSQFRKFMFNVDNFLETAIDERLYSTRAEPTKWRVLIKSCT